jgi:putative SOS response-associated peptidase YedK
MIWGFVSAGAHDTNGIFRYKSHIARSEGIFDRPSWATAIRTQRCLIPANGFYEWRVQPSGKAPYYIRPIDQDLFGFAGIYSSWTDPSGVTHGICAIITTASGAESVTTPSRLPVIVDPADEADWLDPTIGDINTLYKIMRPYDPDRLAVVRVGDAINSPKPNSAELIAPIAR